MDSGTTTPRIPRSPGSNRWISWWKSGRMCDEMKGGWLDGRKEVKCRRHSDGFYHISFGLTARRFAAPIISLVPLPVYGGWCTSRVSCCTSGRQREDEGTQSCRWRSKDWVNSTLTGTEATVSTSNDLLWYCVFWGKPEDIRDKLLMSEQLLRPSLQQKHSVLRMPETAYI